MICDSNEIFLIKFNIIELPLYEKALDKYGDNNLFISDAYDCNGDISKDHKSLRTYNKKDLSEFWRMFRELQDNSLT